jgi:hypothetical protein
VFQLVYDSREWGCMYVKQELFIIAEPLCEEMGKIFCTECISYQKCDTVFFADKKKVNTIPLL